MKPHSLLEISKVKFMGKNEYLLDVNVIIPYKVKKRFGITKWSEMIVFRRFVSSHEPTFERGRFRFYGMDGNPVTSFNIHSWLHKLVIQYELEKVSHFTEKHNT